MRTVNLPEGLRRPGADRGCKVLNLRGNDVGTYLDGLKAGAGRAYARIKAGRGIIPTSHEAFIGILSMRH
ncbi:MAG TPA: hypothetical protein VGL95_19220, partial [Acetobacteraceae bacterium]